MPVTNSIPEKETSVGPDPSLGQDRQRRDVIPIPLLIVIFVIVLGLVMSLMAKTWWFEWNRYRSLQTQATQNYAAAVKPLLWLISTDDDNPTFLSELGHCYLNMKNYDNALKYLELAQKYRANLPADEHGNAREAVDFNTNIGRAWFGKGDYLNAEKHLLEGLRFNKLDPFANFYMGEVEMQRNNFVKAADYFKVVARDPYFEPLVKKHYEAIEQKLFAGVEDEENTATTTTLSIP